MENLSKEIEVIFLKELNGNYATEKYNDQYVLKFPGWTQQQSGDEHEDKSIEFTQSEQQR